MTAIMDGVETERLGMDDDPELVELATRLFGMARDGETEQLAAYLDAGVPVNLANDNGDTLVMLAACLLSGASLSGYSTRTWVELGLLTLSAQLLGHSLLNRALRSAGATTVALATLLEVPGASLVAWAWLGQVLPAAVVPGAVLVLAGLAVVIRTQSTSRRALAEAPTP